jgi:hypothetical protein
MPKPVTAAMPPAITAMIRAIASDDRAGTATAWMVTVRSYPDRKNRPIAHAAQRIPGLLSFLRAS